jgi:hypothetical protein
LICVALTTTERDVIAIALRLLEDRLRNGEFDFRLETEFERDPTPPDCGAVIALLSRFS